jgi:phosphoribosylformimino-5-aminoimidazole carboxamide ribotide isomerase
MIIIPAIDLVDGQCVRLFQGKKEAVTTYSNDPEAVARRWESLGAELIHIVDLDGAFTGNQVNLDAIGKIRQSVKIPLRRRDKERRKYHETLLIRYRESYYRDCRHRRS